MLSRVDILVLTDGSNDFVNVVGSAILIVIVQTIIRL